MFSGLFSRPNPEPEPRREVRRVPQSPASSLPTVDDRLDEPKPRTVDGTRGLLCRIAGCRDFTDDGVCVDCGGTES